MADNTDNSTNSPDGSSLESEEFLEFSEDPNPQPWLPIKRGVAPIGSTLFSGTLNLLRIAVLEER